ncbi:hypothetical protein Elgi_37450 [Paenibacillus elgii]|uniref:hypothetical protein n=1 Tax=Paenibacillus elgii TaxID=189691 RepID=UPI002D7D67EF|nr:hypothetical protein Elgi_37450 [Paenibacillus elgii]
MIPQGLGNLFSKLKQMEFEISELEKRIANAVLNESTDKDWYKSLLEEYRELKTGFDEWLTKRVYIFEDDTPEVNHENLKFMYREIAPNKIDDKT